MARGLFTDGFNSLVHFVLGMLAIQFPILIVLFLGYQIVESMILVVDPNFFIDILEFVIGVMLSYIIKTLLSD
jgi:hypothetical protein